jgi:hypothetical protein
MKFLESHEMVANFIKKYVNSTRDKEDIVGKVLMAMIAGTILLQKPSPNKIHREVVTGDSKSTFYRNIHRLALGMPGMFEGVIDNLQMDPRMAMRNSGVLCIDEHIIPHSSDKMEGVDYFYSTTKNDVMLGLSAITMHYYRDKVEYPVAFQFYRRLRELEKYGKEKEFAEKNTIARAIIRNVLSKPGAPDLLLMDSFFMTKDNVRLVKEFGVHYISRPKRTWSCSYKHKKTSLADLFESIPLEEFKEVVSINPKTGKKRRQKAAIRDVFISKIGRNRIVFIDCTKEEKDEGDNVEIDKDSTIVSGTGRRFRIFVTDLLDWDAAAILSKYAVRWTIETSYRDMSQDLNLHGCQWRELSGQYCFIVLTFLSYVFLMWARVNGLLTEYGVELQTIGQLKEGFRHYCQARFIEWFSELKKECGSCPIANWLFNHIFRGTG